MNYEQIYKNFIDKYKDQEILLDTYYEKHHIIPKHMGGGNEESSRSKYLFVTPTGLTFNSVRNMYNYFKHKVPLHTLENWCKREQHGWSRIIKPK